VKPARVPRTRRRSATVVQVAYDVVERSDWAEWHDVDGLPADAELLVNVRAWRADELLFSYVVPLCCREHAHDLIAGLVPLVDAELAEVVGPLSGKRVRVWEAA
jgi:hypothetical protein